MDITKCRIDMRAMTETGRIGYLLAIYNNGAVDIVFGDDRPMRMWASDLTPVSDPCTNCEMALTVTRQREQIAELQGKLDKAYTRFGEQDLELSRALAERDNWESTARQHCRNAVYWREELSKLQKEALAECHKTPINCVGDDDRRPLGEVAKIYVTARFDASQMTDGIRKVQWKLLSDDAKIVCELLDGSGPMTSWQIAERLHLLERCILENLIEARDAGRIALVNGEYEIVRD